MEQLIGHRVILCGLKNDPQLNGAKGNIVSFDGATCLFVVKLPDERMFSLKAENLDLG